MNINQRSRPRPYTPPESPHMSTNIARMDLVSIRLAVLCADTGSLSAAARRAHCSISTASERLSGLESALGSLLFVRDHRGLRLTAAGSVFVPHARVLLQDLHDLMKQTRFPELGQFSPTET